MNRYNQIKNRRKIVSFSIEEKRLIANIKDCVKHENVDNVSRTNAYRAYYQLHNDIKWSFLASMVSRNAGWNMTDLKGIYFPKLIHESVQNRLFLTFERANWLIFEDAFPQLLIYERSKQLQKPLFYLLCAFSVSVFMEEEWERYWKEKDVNRLLIALIINEQHIIQKPVIEHPYFQKHVFHSLIFQLQELLHFRAALFPTLKGKLYGFSVQEFVKVSKRIQLGKKLAALLFSPNYYNLFKQFSDETVHTGSRIDYEQYAGKKNQDTPFLRNAFPRIMHHRHDYNDWFHETNYIESFFSPASIETPVELTEWFASKQKQLHHISSLDTIFLPFRTH